MSTLPADLAPPEGDADSLLASAAALGAMAAALAVHRRAMRRTATSASGAWSGRRSDRFAAGAATLPPAWESLADEVARTAVGLRSLGHRLREATEEVAAQRRHALAGADPELCAQAARGAKEDYARAASHFAACVGSRSARVGPAPLPDVVRLALAATSVAQVATWWRALSTQQQRATVSAYPELVGGLAGVPGRARDRANRLLLPRAEQEVRRRLAQLEQAWHGYEPYGRGLRLPSREVADLEGKLRALAVLRRVALLPGHYLLSLDAWAGHDLHAAVAVGDVDTAHDVAVFVPGMTSNIQDSLVAYDQAMADVRGHSGAPHTAAVTWLGYDAPRGDDLLAGWLSVGSAHLARTGGERLAGFLRGVRPDAHLTLLAHSYGSVAAGYALRQRGTGVDDAVLFGSPGAAVDDAHDLHVPSGHLWSLSAAGDLVASVERFGALPPTLPGFRVLDTGPEPEQHLNGVTGHSHYLDVGTSSLQNIAAVVAGRFEELVPAAAIAQPEHLGSFR